MRAVIIEKPGFVLIKDIPEPVLKSHEVLLRPRAGGICGTDVHILDGNFIGSYPVIPCHELSAEIVTIGDDVSGLRVGDSVVVDPNIRCGQCARCRDGEINLCENYEAIGVTRPGGFAQLVTVPAKNVHKFEGCGYSAAAFAEPLACVLYGLSKLNIMPGSRILIWGAGAIGLLHMQICSRMHGALLTITDIDASRIELAKGLGAKEAIGNDDYLEAKLKQIMPSGWDIAIDATGNVSALNQMFNHLRRGGQALIFGVYPKKEFLSISPFDVFLNDWRIYGSFTYRHEFAAAVRVLSSGIIDVQSLIDIKINLEQVPITLGRLAKGEKLGKVQVDL